MTDIVDRIRQVAIALGWKFTYGEADIKNLIEAAQAQDLTPDEVHLMLLPVVRTPQTNEYGGISAINYELAFSIFTPDDFDIIVEDNGKEYYWHKFDYKVKPMLTAYYYLHRNLICPGIALQPRRITEIYNDGTENLTGIFIEASATIEVDSRLGEVVPVPPLPPVPTLCELLEDCEVFESLEQRVTYLEAVTPADLISSDDGNALQAGTDGGLYVPQSGSGFECNDLESCENFTDVRDTANQAASDAGAALAELPNKANTADLATVATTGSYNDLTDQPTIPAAQIQSDWNQANNAAVDFIKNKPVIPIVPTNVSSFVNDAGYVNQAGARSALSFVAGSGAYNSGTGVITIPTNNNQITNGANYITLAQARAGSYTKFFADFANTSVNTNTSNVVIGSVLIPANTVTGNAILEIETAISRAVSGANPGHRLFINTSNAFAGATQIAAIGIGPTVLWSKGERSFKCGTGTLRGFAFAIAAPIDDAGNANAPSSTSIDWTLDHYILTVVNNATGETTTHEYTTVKVLTV